MKKILLTLIAAALCLVAAGQARITTKRYRLSDFTERITKVVLPGNDIMDTSIKQAVLDGWRISPFEFCTTEEFKTLKKSSKYYFLLVSNADVSYLTITRGGSEEGIGSEEIVSIPLGDGDNFFGRERVFLPAMVEILQDYILKAMEKEKDSYAGLSIYNSNYRKDGRLKRICFSEDDLSSDVDMAAKQKLFDEDMFVSTEEEADSIFNAATFNTLVSYVVAPAEPKKGDTCYKMLIDASTLRLFWIKKHKISGEGDAGFRKEDLRALSRGR